MTNPRLKRYFRWEAVPPDEVCLLSEKERILLRGDGICEVMPLLDGDRSVEQILVELSARVPPARVFSVLDELRREGHLADGPTPAGAEETAFWEFMGVAAQEARLRLGQRTVAVAGQGGIDPGPLVDMLASMGIDAVRGQAGEATPSLQVVVVDDYLRPELAALNRSSLATGCPVLLVKPVGIEPWVGPLFIPDQTGCWACLAHRLRGHRR
ncbi:MAG: TOMM precursor leader peptide-binding protein, partial [Myxococcales bacterium]|nr:TOMM precursor leader peptide-binding protein [Myxococcales bacterium]